MDDVHKVVLYLGVRAWFAILHQPCQPLQPIIDRLINMMSLIEDRSDGDRIHSPVHAVVVILVHDPLQRQKRAYCFGLVLIAYFVIPFYVTFIRHIVLQVGDADIAEAIDLAKD